MNSEYSVLAKYYDRLGAHLDYREYADFADEINKKHGEGKSGIALDLCCGTGSLSVFLQMRGYDVIGVDASPDMLDEARNKTDSDILYICQDMRELDLYGTVDMTLCALDSLNYLTNSKDLKKVFSLVHNFSEPGGIFIFDLNSKRKFEEVYGDNSYVFDENDVFCSWQNSFNKKTGICDFYISLFEKSANGMYTRRNEWHREKYHSDKNVTALLLETGFEIIGKYSEMSNNIIADGNELRRFYAAKAIK